MHGDGDAESLAPPSVALAPFEALEPEPHAAARPSTDAIETYPANRMDASGDRGDPTPAPTRDRSAIDRVSCRLQAMRSFPGGRARSLHQGRESPGRGSPARRLAAPRDAAYDGRRVPFYAVVTLVGFALLTVAMLLGASVGRWLVVRALGVRGVRFPFGAGTRWCWTTTSTVPQALAFLGAMAGMYAAPALCTSAGLWINGEDSPDEASMRVVVEPDGTRRRRGAARRRPRRRRERRARDDVGCAAERDRAAPAGGRGRRGDAGGERASLRGDAGRRRAHPRVATPMGHRDVGLGEGLRVGALAPGRFLFETGRAVVQEIAGTRGAEASGPVAIVKETRNQSKRGSVLVFFGMLGGYMLPFLAFAALFLVAGTAKEAL